MTANASEPRRNASVVLALLLLAYIFNFLDRQILGILAAPIQYEREIVGLLEVLSTRPYAFEESDITIVERLAQTVLLTVSQMDAL